MKTISIKQPWAHLICTPRKDNPFLGIKDIENRTWPTKFRGRVLVHAGAKEVKNGIDIVSQIDGEAARHLWFEENDGNVAKSSIIGSVEIVDCVVNHPSIWAEESYQIFAEEQKKPIHGEVIYNWVLANPLMFPEPIQAKGKLSFWDFPNILAEPEEKDGELFCHCQLPVKEKNQVMSVIDHFECRYCGGRWYK